MNENIKKNFSKIGLAFLVYIIVWRSLPSAIYRFAEMYMSDFSQLNTTLSQMIISYASLYLVAFPLFLLILQRIPDQELSLSLNKKISFQQIFFLFLIGMSVTFIISIAFSLFFLLFSDTLYNPVGDFISSLDLIPVLIFTCVIAPIMEEIVFRKILYKKISGYGSAVYMISSALFFSLFHLNLSQATYAFFLGLILAWIMYRTGKVIYPILFHFAANILGGNLSLILALIFGEETALMISERVIYFVLISGIILGIILLSKMIKKEVTIFHKGNLDQPEWSTVFGNLGYIVFIVLTGTLIILSFVNDILLVIN